MLSEDAHLDSIRDPYPAAPLNSPRGSSVPPLPMAERKIDFPVDAVLAKRSSSTSWNGEESSAGGRPRSLTPAQAKQLVNLVFDERGGAKVTIPCSAA